MKNLLLNFNVRYVRAVNHIAAAAAFAACLSLANPVDAGILVSGTDLTSSRDVGNGVTATSGWETNDFTISWDISFNSTTSLWDYEYTFSNAVISGVGGNVSHWIFEVSPEFTSSDISDASFKVEGPGTTSSPSSGNPFLPGDIFGIKADTEASVYTFSSTKAPIWGDFYGKDGKTDGVFNAAWNTGFGTDPLGTTTDFTNWVATPDTVLGLPPVVPEPASLAIWSLLAVGCGAGALRRRKKNA